MEVIAKKQIVDLDGLDVILNQFIGKDINISLIGEIEEYTCFEGFQWYIAQGKSNAILFLENENMDKHFSIIIDLIEEYQWEDLLQELTIITDNGNILQLWSDLL